LTKPVAREKVSGEKRMKTSPSQRLLMAALRIGLAACVFGLIHRPCRASATFYHYDVLLQGEWGVYLDTDDEMGSVSEWVNIPGTARIDFGPDFLVFDYPYAEYGDYVTTAPKTAITPMQLDLYFGEHHKSISGHLRWEALTTGYEWVYVSKVDGLSFETYQDIPQFIPESLAFTLFEYGQPPSAYYDYTWQIWTKNAWLFDDERVAPWGLYFSNGQPIPESNSITLLLLGLAGMTGGAALVRRRRPPGP
jgi:hypothetical protein